MTLGTALLEMCRMAKQPNMEVNIGEFGGFPMSVTFDSFWNKFTLTLKGKLSHKVELGADALGNLQRISNALEAMPGKKEDLVQKLANVEQQLETAKAEVQKPFPKEAELQEKIERLAQLNALLNMDEKGDATVVMDDGDTPNIKEEMKAEKVADSPKNRISIKEKLAEMRGKVMAKNKANYIEHHKNMEKEL